MATKTDDDTTTKVVTPITKAKGTAAKGTGPARTRTTTATARTRTAQLAKGAEAGAEAAEDEDLPEGKRMLSGGKLIAASLGMGALLYEIYRHLGVWRAGGHGFLAIVAGFLILAGVCYAVSLITLHMLHVHHRSMLRYACCKAGEVITWGFRRIGDALTAIYVRGAAILGPAYATALAWANDRWPCRGAYHLTAAQIEAAVRAAWCDPDTKVKAMGIRPPRRWGVWVEAGAIDADLLAAHAVRAAALLGDVLGVAVEILSVSTTRTDDVAVVIIAPVADGDDDPDAPGDEDAGESAPAEAAKPAEPEAADGKHVVMVTASVGRVPAIQKEATAS
jgi:hypothetical protein